jgi:hypothetical protein
VLIRIRQHLSYANVMATVAVFLALGSSGYAAFRVDSDDVVDNSIRSKDIRNRALTARDVRRNSLGGLSIRESRLGRVPRARRADLVGGLSVSALRLHCPDGTKFVSGLCIERQARAPAAYAIASAQCESAERSLPLHHQLTALVSDDDITLADGGELTAHVYPSSTSPDELDVLFVTSKAGATALTPDTAAGAKAFRCVAYPSN